MRSFKFLLILFVLPAFLPLCSNAQIDDVGLWTSILIKKQLTRELEGSVTQEIRFNHDVTTVDAVISDAGLEYSFTKKLKAGFHYRFINNNQETYYSKRHRLYLDVSWKEKFKSVTITLRERLQEQYNDINSSETGKIPVWNIRSKLSFKFDVKKKYTPYISAEMYYLLDNAKEIDHIVTRFRYETGIVYEINRIHAVNPYLLFQEIRSPGFTTLVYGVEYSLSF